MKKILLTFSLFIGTLCLNATSPILVAPTTDSINAPTEIFLMWQHLTGASYYDVDVDTTPLFNSTYHITHVGMRDYSGTGGGAVITDTLIELHYGTKYYWKVTPRNFSSSSSINNFTTVYKPQIAGPANGMSVDALHAYPSVYHDLGTHFYYLEVGNTTIFTSPVYYHTYGDMILTPNQNVLNLGPISNIYPNNTYYWRVKEYNLQDTSNWSDTAYFYAVEPISTTEILNKTATFFPNPATEQLQFSFIETETMLSVYNAEGEIVLREKLVSNEQKINISTLAVGIYILKTETQNNIVSTYKLCISR